MEEEIEREPVILVHAVLPVHGFNKREGNRDLAVGRKRGMVMEEKASRGRHGLYFSFVATSATACLFSIHTLHPLNAKLALALFPSIQAFND